MSESARVLIALIVARAFGAAIAASGTATLLNAADFVVPTGTLWLNAVRMTIIPRALHPPLPPGAADAAGQTALVGRPELRHVDRFARARESDRGGRERPIVRPVVVSLLLGLVIARSPPPSRTALVGSFRR